MPEKLFCFFVDNDQLFVFVGKMKWQAGGNVVGGPLSRFRLGIPSYNPSIVCAGLLSQHFKAGRQFSVADSSCL